MRKVQIFPSILAADMGHLADACRDAIAAGADGLHIDIMDGQFVNNISMGLDTIAVIDRVVPEPLSVHLMVVKPDLFVERCVNFGADTVLIHVEARSNVSKTLGIIRDAGGRPGIVLNPDTPADAAQPFMADVDEVLCMTVHPGFGGQSFIREVLPKIRKIREAHPAVDISVDGGLDQETSELCAAEGANIYLVGTTIFKAPDMAEEIGRIRERTQSALQNSGT